MQRWHDYAVRYQRLFAYPARRANRGHRRTSLRDKLLWRAVDMPTVGRAETLITVAICTWNRAHLLRQTLET